MNVVLVTGASGFVGRHAIPALLERGFTVHAVARQPAHHPPAHPPAIWHKVDLLDGAERRALLEAVRPTHLLHLAWEARHGYFWEAPENLDWVAVTLDLVRLFRSTGGVRTVFAGSCAEYDWAFEGLADGVCRERQTPCRPASFYGIAKHATHELTAAYAARTGLSHAWGRIFFMYGPFETATKFVPSVIQSLLSARPVKLGSEQVMRDFLDVRDVGTALAALLASTTEGPVNIGSGEGATVAAVARRLARLTGRQESLLEFGARPSPTGEPIRLVADVKRLRDEVGFLPTRDLQAGLADAVAWWQVQQAVQ